VIACFFVPSKYSYLLTYLIIVKWWHCSFFNCSVSDAVYRGEARILHCGATEADRPRRQNRGAEGGGDWGRRVPLPNRVEGLGSVVSSPPVGSGAPTHFWHIWGPQKTYGRENSVTFASLAGALPWTPVVGLSLQIPVAGWRVLLLREGEGSLLLKGMVGGKGSNLVPTMKIC